MRILLNRRPIAAFLLLVFGLALLAACAPAATPTPTTAPTVAPTPTEEVVEVEPTEEPTEEPAADATEVVEETPEATEVVETTPAADATEAADAEATDVAAAEDEMGAEAASGDGLPGIVGVTSARVREDPSARGTVILEIPAGTAVTALGETANAGYLFIRLEDGTEGWVSKQMVNLQEHFVPLPIMEP